MTQLSTLTTGWMPVCPAEELAEAGSRTAVDLPTGERCMVLNVDGALRALSALCTHRDLTLEGGMVKAGVITCPWHRARFDLCTGQGTRPAAGPLKTFNVAVVDGTVCVQEKGDA
jgi:nitrite reductase/ring-hydroxylating ferredoxin subunit